MCLENAESRFCFSHIFLTSGWNTSTLQNVVVSQRLTDIINKMFAEEQKDNLLQFYICVRHENSQRGTFQLISWMSPHYLDGQAHTCLQQAASGVGDFQISGAPQGPFSR